MHLLFDCPLHLSHRNELITSGFVTNYDEIQDRFFKTMNTETLSDEQTKALLASANFVRKILRDIDVAYDEKLIPDINLQFIYSRNSFAHLIVSVACFFSSHYMPYGLITLIFPILYQILLDCSVLVALKSQCSSIKLTRKNVMACSACCQNKP